MGDGFEQMLCRRGSGQFCQPHRIRSGCPAPDQMRQQHQFEPYDDGAVLIDGKPVVTSGTELRVRYLTPYNVLLCGHAHAIIQSNCDDQFKAVLDGILQATHTFADLIALIRDLPLPARHNRFDDGW